MFAPSLVRRPCRQRPRCFRNGGACFLTALFLAFAISPERVLAQTATAAATTTTPLQQIVAEALKNNPEIRAARKEREAAAQRIAPAGALDDPMLEAGIISLPTESLSFNREDMTMKMLGVSQRFPYPGKRALRRNIAAQDAQSSAYGYQETLNRVAREVKIAYFDLYKVLEATRLVEKNKAIVEQFLRIAETRYSVGQSTQADVLKAQTQLSKMIEELIMFGRERPMFEAELTRALGRTSGSAPPVPVAPQLQDVALPLATLTDNALRQRPQLLGLQSAIAKNEKMLAMARKEYYPDFDVRLSYGQRDNMPDGTRRSDMVNLTVAINLPVWRANKLAPRVTEAEAMREAATDMYQAMRNEIGMKLRQQVAIAEQSRRAAHLYQTELLPQARLSVEAALAAYKVNRVDFMTLLDNQMTVFKAEIGYAAALVDHNKALAEIDFATGNPVQVAEQ
jgi:cobalt-zinc-cadmium efflux system outer membrane protein